jgi:hypothetical protein
MTVDNTPKTKIFTDLVINDEMINYEKIDICTHPCINSELLEGYIGISVIFDTEGKYLDFPVNISLPVCFLSSLPVSAEMEMEKNFTTESLKRKAPEIEKFTNLYTDLFSNYEKYLNNPHELASLSKENLNNILTILKEYQSFLPNIGSFIEQKEMWSYLEKICIVESTIVSLIALFNEKTLA